VGEVVVDEPHPRNDAFRTSQRFATWCAQLQALLSSAEADAVAGAVSQ